MAKGQKCPRCGGWVTGEDGKPSEGTKLCTPVSSPGCWEVVGKATAPHPVTGHRRMLNLVDTEGERG